MSSSDHFNLALDQDFSSFSYPNAYTDYAGPDIFGTSYLSGSQLGFQLENRLDDPILNPPLDLQKSSHDDLNQFFADPAFLNMAASPLPAHRYSDLKSQNTLGRYSPVPWQRGVDPSSQVDPWATAQQPSSLAIGTPTLEKVDSRDTVMHHGQVTPGDSPASPFQSSKPQRKTTRKTKATTKKSESHSTRSTPAAESAPAKKTRKPRRSSKKPATPEQEALRRETFLKRNREAAYKCRIKKKTQTEMIMERAKALDANNAMKGVEVQQLRREVERLRALLMLHYRECRDEALIEYMDGMVKRESWAGSFAYSSVETDTTSPASMDRATERRESENVFEMREFEESIALAGSRRSSNAASSVSGLGSSGMLVQEPAELFLDAVAATASPPPLDFLVSSASDEAC